MLLRGTLIIDEDQKNTIKEDIELEKESLASKKTFTPLNHDQVSA